MFSQGKAHLGGQQGMRNTPKHIDLCPYPLTHNRTRQINIRFKWTDITGRKREVTLKLNGIQRAGNQTE